ncbi:MAG TPA: MFS transporter, partial [Pyrinomonadaceae bacterium]|nr:MFS transporter [Pyrinomonadaceae bacterium]
LTPLMLSWVGLSIVGGRLLLKVGYRPTTLAGLFILTLGFAFLSSFQRTTPRVWLYVDLMLIGAGLGLTMLTLLIAVQQAVARTQLGTATSLNQFSRSIGGAVGVAIMGAVLSAGLASHLQRVASAPGAPLTPERAAELASNPNALIEPSARAALPPLVLEELQDAMAATIHNVFWTGTALAGLALLVALRLPRSGDRDIEPPNEEACCAETGERMVIAEFATLEPEEEPVATKGG